MATLRDIAAITGVSISTVSIVLRGQARERHLSSEVERNVLAAAAELGYRPNLSARQLRDTEDHPLFLAVYVADDFHTPMMLRFLTGLREELTAPFELVIRLYHPRHLAKAVGPEVLRLFHAAIICNATEHDLRALENAPPRIPVILYNRNSPVFPSVSMDHEAVGTLPARIFASHGRKHAVCLNAEGDYRYLQIRQEAFCRTAREKGMKVTVLSCPDTMDAGRKIAGKIAALHADCLFTAGDQLAIGVLRGLPENTVPDKLELISVGNGDTALEQHIRPSLSVIDLPMEEMARRCFALVRAKLDGADPSSEILPVKYISRESCETLDGQ